MVRVRVRVRVRVTGTYGCRLATYYGYRPGSARPQPSSSTLAPPRRVGQQELVDVHGRVPHGEHLGRLGAKGGWTCASADEDKGAEGAPLCHGEHRELRRTGGR